MILNQMFEKETFVNFVHDFLPDFIPEEREVRTSEKSLLQTIEMIGTSKKCNLSVLSIYCDESNAGKRITITQNAFKVLRDHQIRNALVAFHHGGEQWRLSLLTSALELKDGKIVSKESNPKRYSYLLGEGAKTNTPYKFLVEKGKVQDIEALSERFSVEIVNKQFFESISSLFTELAGGERNGRTYESSLYIQGGRSGSHGYQEFAVRLIGRIMFCWFLKEKRSAEGIQLIPEDLLSTNATKNHSEYYHSIIEPLFFEVLNKRLKDRPEAVQKEMFEMVPYLNGGLFAPQQGDRYKYDPISGGGAFGLLTIPNEWFDNLFNLLSRYNFTIDENTSYDTDLSIDPEMLGRIFENLLAEINPETGESARKSTGSFYTPRGIVEYMVDSSLMYYLAKHTLISEAKLKAIISYSKDDDAEQPLNSEEKELIVDALANLKILDPACGSGAFPIGILQKVVYILQQADETAVIWLKKQLYGISSVELRRDIEEKYKSENYDYLRKLGVIRTSIFGVDVQTIATEIAKLRCFLTLIIEEQIDETKENRGLKPLPNLDFKFVTANSLIGLRADQLPTSQMNLLEDVDQMSELKRIREDYFTADKDLRERLRNDFDRLQKQMLLKTIDTYKGNVTELYKRLTRWAPFDNEPTKWFDSEWMFGIDVFDIVIANPPYVDSEEMVRSSSALRQHCSENYKSARGNWDLFIPFVELGSSLAGNNGGFTFILPNKIIAAKYAKALRKLIASKVIEIRDYSQVRVFKEADVYPITLIASNNPYMSSAQVRMSTMNSENGIPIAENVVSREMFANSENWDVFFTSDKNLISVIDKMRKYSELDKIAHVSGAATVSEAYKLKNILLDDKLSMDLRFKFINTGTIDRYRSLWGVKTTQYIKDRYSLPSINRESLNELFHQRYLESTSPKIIIGGMTKILECYYDCGQYLAGKSTTIVFDSSVNLKYLLGLLNSKLMSVFYSVFYNSLSLSGGFFRIGPPQVKQLPIAIGSKEQISSVIKLVDQIHVLINEKSDSRTNELEEQVDALVYEIYGLTDEEVITIKAL